MNGTRAERTLPINLTGYRISIEAYKRLRRHAAQTREGGGALIDRLILEHLADPPGGGPDHKGRLSTPTQSGGAA